MPALSYKERFVPMVKDGSKHQSIRAFRKRFLFMPEQTLMHYFGMRTKHCYKIRENTICKDVETIFIFKDGTVVLGPPMEESEAMFCLKNYLTDQNRDIYPKNFYMDGKYVQHHVEKLNRKEKDQLAWNDGFRLHDRKGNTYTDTTGCFAVMRRWWNQTHDLPFTGQLIKW